MDLGLDNFDFIEDEGDKEYSPVPDGWYDAHITSAELRTTKNGNGRYIALRYDITGDDYAGRVIWGNVTINNPNPKAEHIGRVQLSRIAKAIGMTQLPNDEQELVGSDIKIKTGIRAATEQYAATNDVKDWKPVSGGSKMPPVTKSDSNTAAPWAK